MQWLSPNMGHASNLLSFKNLRTIQTILFKYFICCFSFNYYDFHFCHSEAKVLDWFKNTALCHFCAISWEPFNPSFSNLKYVVSYEKNGSQVLYTFTHAVQNFRVSVWLKLKNVSFKMFLYDNFRTVQYMLYTFEYHNLFLITI